ncbi:endo-1,4-beta-xylanase [Halocatena marina]|uniref:endo-1,4-beta-xylanase n=1 Tax=Halocatena marina TaxID=2934937 RepID=A0ABD5YUW8_9EURY
MQQEFTDHVRTETSTFKDNIDTWDVINHPIKLNSVWRNQLNSDPAAWKEFLDAAREGDPDGEMLINEAAFRNDAQTAEIRGKYHDMVRYLKDNDADLDGIGFMGHFDPKSIVPPEEALDRLDEFARYGFDIRFTEYDFTDENLDKQLPKEQFERLQADYTRDLLIACFSHPAVTGFSNWGLWQPLHWRDRAAFYREDWSARPHTEEWQRLVNDEWWTDDSGKTDSSGTYTTEGFKGEYEITASYDGTSSTTNATIIDDTSWDGSVTVELDVDGEGES